MFSIESVNDFDNIQPLFGILVFFRNIVSMRFFFVLLGFISSICGYFFLVFFRIVLGVV